MLPSAAREFYATQQAVSLTARNEVRRLWAKMGDDFDASWRRIGPAINAVIAEGQLQMAKKATEYVPRVLAQTGVPDRPQGDLNPDSLSGVASDGRSLTGLTQQSVVQAKSSIGAGSTTGQALGASSNWLQIVAQVQVADAARVAVGTLICARPNIGGYVRVLSPPSCQLCTQLSGQFYRWSSGFERHKGCDCTNQPVPSREYAHSEGFVQNPDELYRKGLVTDLTDAQKMALDNGADFSEVVNAYRGVSRTSTTTRVVNRKAEARAGTLADPSAALDNLLSFVPAEERFRSATVAQSRLTPEGIFQAATTRDEAIQMLRQQGYLK